MPSAIILDRYEGGNPPRFKGSWRDTELDVTLDLSAVLRLAGNVDLQDRDRVLPAKADAITAALARLADIGQIEPVAGRAEMMLSALDLD